MKNRKMCRMCGEEKGVGEFNKNKKTKDGLQCYCGNCNSTANTKSREKILSGENKKEVKKKICSVCDIEKDIDCFGKWRYSVDGHLYSCKDCVSLRYKKIEKNETFRIKRRKIWNRYYKKFNFRLNVSRLIRRHVTKNLDAKSSVFDKLPYTVQELKQHLENKFEPWMTWENYGMYSENEKTWQIDHIISQSKLPYDSIEHENFGICWSLENLRPLSSLENIQKGNR